MSQSLEIYHILIAHQKLFCLVHLVVKLFSSIHFSETDNIELVFIDTDRLLN